ncbi:MAG: AraC family transcriptional regulator [Pseudomonadota bacterium]
MTPQPPPWQAAYAAEPVLIDRDTDEAFALLGPSYLGADYRLHYVRCTPYEVQMRLDRAQIQFSYGRYRSFCAFDSDKLGVEETFGPSASFLPAGTDILDRGDPAVLTEYVTLVVQPDALAEHGAAAGLSEGELDYAWGIASDNLTEQSYHLRTAVLSGVKEGHDPLELDSLASEMVSGFLGEYAGPRRRCRGGLTPQQLRRVRGYVDENLTETLSLQDLAQEAGLSHHHFARQFKQSTTISPYTFVLERRLARAKSWLANCRSSLAEIACGCGFSDQAHFSKQFKKRLGITPAHFRRAVAS